MRLLNPAVFVPAHSASRRGFCFAVLAAVLLVLGALLGACGGPQADGERSAASETPYETAEEARLREFIESSLMYYDAVWENPLTHIPTLTRMPNDSERVICVDRINFTQSADNYAVRYRHVDGASLTLYFYPTPHNEEGRARSLAEEFANAWRDMTVRMFGGDRDVIVAQDHLQIEGAQTRAVHERGILTHTDGSRAETDSILLIANFDPWRFKIRASWPTMSPSENERISRQLIRFASSFELGDTTNPPNPEGYGFLYPLQLPCTTPIDEDELLEDDEALEAIGPSTGPPPTAHLLGTEAR